MSVILLVGHRGVGKTRLLDRISQYHAEARRPVATWDLDREIERAERRSIESLFTREGEAAFRAREKFHFARLLQEAAASDRDCFLALGAGFEGPLPAGLRCLWVRRASDPRGRVFVDRPRLSEKPPLVEYRERFAPREKRYREWATEELSLPEGFDRPYPTERAWFLDELRELGGVLTLLPEQFAPFRDVTAFLKSRLRWGVGAFELRDDLLLPPAMELARRTVPAKKLIFSFRRRVNPVAPFALDGMRWDWPAEWGDCPHGAPPIVSLHERAPADSLADAIARLAKAAGPKAIHKLAVEIRDWRELEAGHAWCAADPRRRAFLPVSPDGRWSWYRLQHRGESGLAFFREGAGSAPDQPLLLDWARTRNPGPAFAAVLGDPVSFSRTPAEHEAFFRARGITTLAVRVAADEWERGAPEALTALGLRYAAITAPLKRHAYRGAAFPSELARRLETANTWRWSAAGWHADNTDAPALAEWLAPLSASDDVVVWGGGGTLAALREALPRAAFYSAREGAPRPGSRAIEKPTTLVWASSVKGIGPPAEWRVRAVYDLSYRESSHARAYALRARAEYHSGLALFERQARRQRDFWK